MGRDGLQKSWLILKSHRFGLDLRYLLLAMDVFRRWRFDLVDVLDDFFLRPLV
jgi:hypothetical protein